MILYKLTFGNKFLVFFGIKSYKTIIILRFHEGSHLLCATLYYAFGGFIIDKALKISNKMYVIFCDELSAMNNSPATNCPAKNCPVTFWPVPRHVVYRHFVCIGLPAYRAIIHPTSVSANHYFHQFQLPTFTL